MMGKNSSRHEGEGFHAAGQAPIMKPPFAVRSATETRSFFVRFCLLTFACFCSFSLFAADKPKEVSFDDIKFEMTKGDPFERSLLTDGIEKLHGKPIKIRGYMLPSFQQKGITQFVLVRDNMECCFGPGAALFDCIVVEMVDGESTSFTVRPIAVEGVFKISEFLGPDGKHLAIYHLDGKAVK